MAESSRQAAARSASPNPPPLPTEQPPLPADSTSIDAPVDQPIDSLGDDDDEDDEGDDEDAAENAGEVGSGDEQPEDGASGSGGTGESSKGKGRATAGEEIAGATSATTNGDTQGWQAVWAPEQNAWYFWNQNTGAVTWTNPLQPVDPSAPPLPPGPPPPRAVDAPRSQLGGVLPDIDPDLAYLLPADQRGGSSRDGSVQTAQFNSRSGKFTAGDTNYRFDALDEFNRQKRFNDHYFDTEAWEKQRAEEHAKRKRDEELGIQPDSKITKKDMDRFRKKQAEKKWRKQAWLRD